MSLTFNLTVPELYALETLQCFCTPTLKAQNEQAEVNKKRYQSCALSGGSIGLLIAYQTLRTKPSPS